MKADGMFARVLASLGLALGANLGEAGSPQTHPELGWLIANCEAGRKFAVKQGQNVIASLYLYRFLDGGHCRWFQSWQLSIVEGGIL